MKEIIKGYIIRDEQDRDLYVFSDYPLKGNNGNWKPIKGQLLCLLNEGVLKEHALIFEPKEVTITIEVNS